MVEKLHGSPSPMIPLPLGEGNSHRGLEFFGRSSRLFWLRLLARIGLPFPLSQRERAGVREKRTATTRICYQ